jgi:hypothetical protein
MDHSGDLSTQVDESSDLLMHAFNPKSVCKHVRTNSAASSNYAKAKTPCHKTIQAKKDLETKECQECTFQPKLGKVSRGLAEGLKPWEVRQAEFEKKRAEAMEERKKQALQREEVECSFKP